MLSALGSVADVTKPSLGPGSALWEKGEKIGVGEKKIVERSEARDFSYLTPFFAFFPHCGAWFQAKPNPGW